MLIDISIDVEFAIVAQFITLAVVSVLEILFVRSINRRESEEMTNTEKRVDALFLFSPNPYVPKLLLQVDIIIL